MTVIQQSSNNSEFLSLKHLPVIGICGLSGAGKTTVIEAILPDLKNQGLRVAVVKHNTQHVQIDKPGKDSFRFFEAGADVYLFGEEETCRIHNVGGKQLIAQLAKLSLNYDLVLVEGHGNTPIAKLWMLSEKESQPPVDINDILMAFSRIERKELVFQYLMDWIHQVWLDTSVWGCVLIGGQSRRMGQPKHLLLHENGQNWLEHTVSLLAPFVDRIVLSGSGQVPVSLRHLTRIPDVPGTRGPLSGILSAYRWNPGVSWLLLACDMPDVSEASIQWLLNQRAPGIWGVVPRDEKHEQQQPLFSYYDKRCGKYFEELNATGSQRIGNISQERKIIKPTIPDHIIEAWRNVNTPQELEK